MERMLFPDTSAENGLCNEVLQVYVWNNEVAFVAWFLEGVVRAERARSQEEVPWLRVSPDIQRDFKPIKTPIVQKRVAKYALIIAATNGYVPMLQDLLLKTDNMDVNWVHPGTGETALEAAVHWGRWDVFQLLVEHGASPGKGSDGDAPLLRRILRRGDLPMLKEFNRLSALELNVVQILEQQHGKERCSVLEYAARRGKIDILRHLLQIGIFSPKQVLAAKIAAEKYGREDTCQALSEALAQTGSDEDATLLENVADVESSIITLTDALERGHLLKVKNLLSTAGPGIVDEQALVLAVTVDDAQALQILIHAINEPVGFDCDSLLSKTVEVGAVKCLDVLRNAAYKDKVLGFKSASSFEESLAREVVNWHQGGSMLNSVNWNSLEQELAEELLETSVVSGNLRTAGELLKCKGCKLVLQNAEKLKDLAALAAVNKHFDILGLIIDSDKSVSYKV